MIKHLSLFLFFLIFSFSAGAQNLFYNPDFEEGDDGWHDQVGGDGQATFNYESGEAYTGSYGLHVQVIETSEENHQIQLNTPSGWVAEEGVTYTISFYAKTDENKSFHLAAQDGPPGYAYRAGTDISLTTEWRRFEYSFTADTSGEGVVRFNFFLGAQTGDYYFDNFSLVAEDDIELPAPTPPTEGAWESDVYRNMLAELGKTPEQINSKIDEAFNQLFYGNPENEAIYYETDDDMAYILDVSANDIRTEGVSYGMMIAVQLDKQEEFDKLWKFAKTYMQHQEGPRKGYFAWQVDADTYEKLDNNSAPDGEVWFAMSLFFASHRWGDGEGIFDYQAEAQALLYDMLNLEERNGGIVDGLTNMFNRDEKQIVFVPEGENAEYTDPSYHVPGFFKLFAKWSEHDNELWSDIADTSRSFLLKAMHPETGLTTEYMTFDAQPKETSFNDKSHYFAYDSWRVVGNVAMDAHWFGEDWHTEQADKVLSFFNAQGTTYPALYEQDGTPLEDNHSSPGLVAMNAAGTLASAEEHAWTFLNSFYNQSVPTGEHRYYDGVLHMLGLLHTSGNFRIWAPDETTSAAKKSENAFSVTVYPNPANAGQGIVIKSEDLEKGTALLKDSSGRILRSTELVSGEGIIATESLAKGMYFIQVTSSKGSYVKKVIVQ
ncbi:glycosyl hydrolase family 8 [Cytophagaceae bacterium ABcell3]|nr:glycosyl hydrolase family 8 [Cytophagaceae bacterium ABcell3]